MIADALAYSSLLALSSLGLALCIVTTRVDNFAHADYLTVGAYTALFVSHLLHVTPYLAVPASMLVSGALAALSYAVVFEPLRRHGLVTLMIASMALDVVLRACLGMLADWAQSVLGIYARGFIFKDMRIRLLGNELEAYPILAPTLTAGALLLLYLVLYHTKLGVKMRAVAENAELAEVLGVNSRRTLLVSWFLAGALAGAAGALLPFRVVVSPDTGTFILLTLFASVTLGGLHSLAGAVLGAYVIGFSETLLTYYLASAGLSTAYRPLLAFAVIASTLLVRPEGLSSLWRRR